MYIHIFKLAFTEAYHKISASATAQQPQQRLFGNMFLQRFKNSGRTKPQPIEEGVGLRLIQWPKGRNGLARFTQIQGIPGVSHGEKHGEPIEKRSKIFITNQIPCIF